MVRTSILAVWADDQLELARPYNEQIRGPLALEYAASIDADLTMCVRACL
jgi:hypothetical protein